jgi:septal ring factor EnvC (AmiA/AmiB activator)
MKNCILLLILSIGLFGCENKESLTKEIEALKQERTLSSTKLQELNSEVYKMESKLSVLNEQVKESGILASGRMPKYVVRVKLKQSHYSLKS